MACCWKTMNEWHLSNTLLLNIWRVWVFEHIQNLTRHLFWELWYLCVHEYWMSLFFKLNIVIIFLTYWKIARALMRQGVQGRISRALRADLRVTITREPRYWSRVHDGTDFQACSLKDRVCVKRRKWFQSQVIFLHTHIHAYAHTFKLRQFRRRW